MTFFLTFFLNEVERQYNVKSLITMESIETSMKYVEPQEETTAVGQNDAAKMARLCSEQSSEKQTRATIFKKSSQVFLFFLLIVVKHDK